MSVYKLVPPSGRDWAGVNLLDDARRIQDNELAYAKNALPVRPGMLSKRGSREFAYKNYETNSQIIPVGFALAPWGGTYKFVSALNIAPSILDSLQIRAVNGDGQTGNYCTVNNFARIRFTSFREQLFVFVGSNIGMGFQASDPVNPILGLIIQRKEGTDGGSTDDESINNGISISKLTLNGNTFAPSMAAVYKSRMVYAYGTYLIFSDRNKPTTVPADALAANGRAIAVGEDSPGVITAINEVMLTTVGSPAQSALLVHKANAAYLLTGEPGEIADSDALGDLSINRFNINCGCVAPLTIVRTPYGLVWASPDDVWIYEGGALPRRIGSKIRPALQWTPASQRHRWVASYFNGFYRLAIFSQGTSGEFALNGDGPLGEQWFLDLRNDAPASYREARWWGPQIFNSVTNDSDVVEPGTYFMLSEDNGESDPVLYGLEKGVYSAGNYAAVIVTYDGSSVRDTSHDTSLFATDGMEIEMELHTKNFDFDDPNVKKRVFNVETSVYVTDGLLLHGDLVRDNGKDTTSMSEYVAPDTALQVDSGILDAGSLMHEEQQAVVLRPNALYPPTGRTIQLRLYDSATNVVVADYNDTIGVIFDRDEIFGGATSFLLTLTPGEYATLYDLAQHVCTVLSTAGWGNFTHNIPSSGATPQVVRFTSDQIAFAPNLDESVQNFPTGTTAAQQEASRRIWARFGFTTASDPDGNTALPLLYVDGDFAVYNQEAPNYELHSLNFDFEHQLRRAV